MDFSFFYFGNDNGSVTDRYRLLMAGARFADEHGFTAVWTPERHFHEFGGTYPNPSVTGAAIAAVTSRVQVRAGSVVAPLHHPLRIAEEWSVVDNISGGRVGISFASGWHARDFVLRPENYADRRSLMFEQVEQVRQLWRGAEITALDGAGRETAVRAHPEPVRPELPVWITSGGDVETFRSAGRIGAGLLTHLLGQEPEQLGERIAEYRAAAREAGHPGHVVLMVHAFLGEDDDLIRETVRPPLHGYLRSSLGLLLGSLEKGARKIDPATLREKDIQFLLERSFTRYYDNGGLLGSLDRAVRTVERLAALGVDELACLVDFGLPTDDVIAGFKYLNRLRELSGADLGVSR
ncbi:MupA/Atu3671 family FMN-dependent luciferase-like monooxygenase [Actinokineospora diospyrosa]|uniref:Natural product biosynthesis luciferase-like monooxygenase domain-containing protein n=1 Tax=Actinokineospora diospyrosa TaxID=103728 RepID=A0ABT1I5W8_9PSEU|nr:MupA/Atu3671 family FMN-dependent luciferase-like monooxygenase [Actinokineospora diospyrosa]MCP2268019.1 natural product biosynthesis luciferase-like monooxygenase domain-containing protein [Actinokineospora diospyrosa]